ncbi:MAG: bifunctional [glutamine synthetase] adenylyltransferase/[glutamine synthetase]-adenylyl-L-tyrosine phosphorylase, partial [Hyphomicrobium sp.]
DLWDLKQVRGGLVDLEFLVQYLELVHAADHPAILDPNTLTALAAAYSGHVLAQYDYNRLAAAGRLLHDLTQLLRLTLEGPFAHASAPEGLKSLMVRSGGAASFEDLESKLKQTLADVREAFNRLIV